MPHDIDRLVHGEGAVSAGTSRKINNILDLLDGVVDQATVLQTNIASILSTIALSQTRFVSLENYVLSDATYGQTAVPVYIQSDPSGGISVTMPFSMTIVGMQGDVYTVKSAGVGLQTSERSVSSRGSGSFRSSLY